MLHLLFTGGTISMQRDATAGGNVPAHAGETLVGFTPGLEQLGSYRLENWAMLPACHFGPERLWQLRERVRSIAESGDVRGIVITHGTDILEETAYLLDRTLNLPIPVVLTGAMRTSSDPDWDGPANLLDAARVAASLDSAGRGVLVAFHHKVFAGRTAVKVHTTNLDAFASPHAAPIGLVTAGGVEYHQVVGYSSSDRHQLQIDNLQAQVVLISMIVGDDGTNLDLLRSHYDGLVIEGFGSGNVPPGAVPAIQRWLIEGKPVVLASRCPLGSVMPLYGFEGGGSRLVAMGVLPAGPRTPSQARMELTIALSAGVTYGD
jgi:L-asparaginase